MDKATILSGQNDMWVSCQTTQGLEIRATLVRLTRYQAVFEVYSPQLLLRMSEVLNDFKIVVGERPVYSGRAIVSNLVNAGTIAICEASLGEFWIDFDVFALITERSRVRRGFEEFIQQWQKLYKINPEFKVLMADIQSFLADMRLWLEQVELGVRSAPSGDRLELERDVIEELSGPIVPALNAMFEKFEVVAQGIETESQPVHHNFVKRQLHPLMLCSPFAYRTYQKPLGYAGDYEMVNMLLRDPQEGSSVFAKVLNVWFLKQPPAQAHRNRIEYLTQKLIDETARVRTEGRMARIYNLGCGPCGEIQNFLREQPLSDSAQFTLIDFNEETLEYARATLENFKNRHGRSAQMHLAKKSVSQILKGASKSVAAENQYDLLYCAGLFDYLPDRICKQLMSLLYEMLAPGGLLVATNVDPINPIRHMLDYVLEWHLLYRSGRQILALAPEPACGNGAVVRTDQTGVNVYLEVRKPAA